MKKKNPCRLLNLGSSTLCGSHLGLAVGGTLAIALAVKFSLGLRPTVEAEQEGLDLSEHGEEGYIFEAKG